jgi:hypothetical protein
MKTGVRMMKQEPEKEEERTRESVQPTNKREETKG